MKLPAQPQLKGDRENRIALETVQNHMREYGKKCARDALEAAAQECEILGAIKTGHNCASLIRQLAKEIV